jgi:hypothetical protein
MKPKREKSRLELAREKVLSELHGKTQLRVNFSALEKETPHYPSAMFYLKAGWYRDEPFICADCGKLEVWTAAQQKWWYEVAKGGILTKATRCRQCRKVDRERRDVHRARSIAGAAAKANSKRKGTTPK